MPYLRFTRNPKPTPTSVTTPALAKAQSAVFAAEFQLKRGEQQMDRIANRIR